MNSNFQVVNNLPNEFEANFNEKLINPKLSTIPLLENPFLNHLDNTTSFFLNNLYQNESVSSIMNGTFFRSSNKTGDTLIDDRIYSLDNILYYWGMRYEDPSLLIIDKISELKKKNLWLSENESTYQYGFIQSTNDTGEEFNTTRYLLDNVAVLLPLIENYHIKENPGTTSTIAKETLESQLELLNSSQFWDPQYGGFIHYNNSNVKFADENFLAVIANILWHRNADGNLQYKDEALDFANYTLSNMSSDFWDSTYDGYYYKTPSKDWSDGSRDVYKYLKTNALGIIALIEYYLETGSSNTTALGMAEAIYQVINDNLYNATGGYERYASRIFDTSFGPMILEDNAWYLMALLSLFKATNNPIYYINATDLFQFLEADMYDDNNGGYIYSKNAIVNETKDFYANNILMRAYQEISEIFSNTELNGNLNGTLFIKGEGTLNLTCKYRFYKEYDFENADSSFILDNNIEGANITFIIRYPNETVLEIIMPANTDSNGDQSISFKINDDLPDGLYSISVYANKSFRATAFNTFYFTVSSGLSFKSSEIEGLEDGIYRGGTLEANLTVSSTRKYNYTLNFSGDSDYFSVLEKSITINGQTDTKFLISVTANFNAVLGNHSINFYIKNGTKLYLTFDITVLIKQSIEVLLVSHKTEAFENDTIPISITFKNYILDTNQSVKVELYGQYIEDIDENVDIFANTIKSKTFNVHIKENIQTNVIKIYINVSRAGESIYFEDKEISILQPVEINSISFPSNVQQGQRAFLIIKITNYKEVPINFTLYINDLPFPTNLNQLRSGENEIIVEFTPTINPYDFQTKEYIITIKDGSGRVLIIETFQTEISLSVLNLVIFYLIPLLIPAIIIIFYKNKEIKSRLLEK